MKYVVDRLLPLAEEGYKNFQAALLPTVAPSKILGVRIPAVRKLANVLSKDENFDKDSFYNELPHAFYEEDLLHASLISLEKDFDSALDLTKKFVPYIDNWAVTDTFSPPIFKRKLDRLECLFLEYLKSEHTYSARFGIVMLTRYFAREKLRREHLFQVAACDRDDYYVSMAVAWYFSVLLSTHFDETVEFLKGATFRRDALKMLKGKVRDARNISACDKQTIYAVVDEKLAKMAKTE